MTNILRLVDVRRRRKIVSFDRAELRQLLNVYSLRVATGEWRDYAIDFRAGMAVFSIFRHTAEQPLFAIAKLAPGSQRNGDYLVISGRQRLAQGRSIGEVLRVFDRRLHLILTN